MDPVKASDIVESEGLAMKVSSSILLRKAQDSKRVYETLSLYQASEERQAVSEAMYAMASKLRKQGL
jgi:hypothetical protein